MSKESGTKPTPSNCDEETVQLVAGREYTIVTRIRKVTLMVLVFSSIFCLGFILGKLNYPDIVCDQMDDFHTHVYAYDTEQKLEDYYKEMEKVNIDELKVSRESPTAREIIAEIRGNRPLVSAGPFVVFVDNDSGKFSVREKRSLLPLVELESREQSQSLAFTSSIEKDRKLPRFSAQLFYSRDGIYEKGVFSVQGEDGISERSYFDTKGNGVFSYMVVYEDGVKVTYRLNNLSWCVCPVAPRKSVEEEVNDVKSDH